MGTGMKVLVTGGAGYIGSTTAKALEAAGHTPIILDSLLCGEMVVNETRMRSWNFISANGGANSAAANSDPAIHLT